MRRLLFLVLAVIVAALGGGCSPYVADYQFLPRPALSEVRAATTQAAPPAATALAAVVGIRYADKKEGIPVCVEVRMRLEATGPEPVTFDPHTLELTNGTLLNFPAPLIRPAGSMTLGPTQSAVVTALFPFPAGSSYENTDLASLQLRWLIQIHGQTVRQAVDFRRVIPVYYYDPYWDYPPYYGPVFYYRGGFYHGYRR